MLGQLVPCGGGPPVPLLKPKLVVGRKSVCDVPLSFPTVSSRHCELELKEGYWFVRDLGSSNGTRVNGTACTSQWLLPNDVLMLAQHRFTVLYAPPADQPPPPRVESQVGAGARPTPQPAPAAGERAVPVMNIQTSAAGNTSLGELVPCGGGSAIPLHKPRLVLGRHRDCDIVLPLAPISGRHCQLDWSDGRWLVRDLGSRNGTKVDAAKLEASDVKCLMPGGVLSIAGLRLQLVYTPPGAAGGPEVKAKVPMFAESLLKAAGLENAPLEPEEDAEPDAPRYNLDP